MFLSELQDRNKTINAFKLECKRLHKMIDKLKEEKDNIQASLLELNDVRSKLKHSDSQLESTKGMLIEKESIIVKLTHVNKALNNNEISLKETNKKLLLDYNELRDILSQSSKDLTFQKQQNNAIKENFERYAI